MAVDYFDGLSRNGVSAAEYPAMLTALRRGAADEAIRLRGIMSHLVYGDDPENPVNDLQSQRLRDMRNQARNHNPSRSSHCLRHQLSAYTLQRQYHQPAQQSL